MFVVHFKTKSSIIVQGHLIKKEIKINGKETRMNSSSTALRFAWFQVKIS